MRDFLDAFHASGRVSPIGRSSNAVGGNTGMIAAPL